MLGEADDYDGIRYILQEMKYLGVKPNLVVYNTLFKAMRKVGKLGFARSLFKEMIDLGISSNEKTLIVELRYMEMQDVKLVEETKILFRDMKQSKHCKLDSWSHTAILSIYRSEVNVSKTMKLFEKMSKFGIKLNVMGSTCLIQCLGKAMEIDDLVIVFYISIERGVKSDDRLWGCLLCVVSLFQGNKNQEKVLTCLQGANPKLIAFIQLIVDEETSFETVKKEFKGIMSNVVVEIRRSFCNCLIDICRNKDLLERTHELLYLGTLYEFYAQQNTI